MSSRRRITMALTLCLSIIAIGTSGYILIEDYTFFEALYMSVITITTVGFGEVKPLSEIGRGFTTVLILVGVGGLAFVGHAIVESLLEKVWSGKSGIRKMRKKISGLKSHYVVCGYGRVGMAAAEYFRETGADFVIIEANAAQTHKIREKGYLIVEGDATREATLLGAGIKSAAGLLALLNSDPDNLFTALTARDLNPMLHIIARAENPSSEKKILRGGANNVISPFATAGKQIAEQVLSATRKRATLHETRRHKAVPQWVSVQEGSSMLGETIRSVSMVMGREIMGLRKNGRDFIFPDRETVLEGADMLLVIDYEEDDESRPTLTPLEPNKLVIVDDNPVILRLYARLFQKVGFHPMTATNGGDGLDLIIREKPVAAVIDFTLPTLTGIEVCRRVRAVDTCKDTKLVLFTADHRAETRKRALEAGADAVVVKSPEASEVIETVLQTLGTSKNP
ncbi:MAG: NAD-binding protein [Thermodesulfobacteriota bacterium]|nr:NAD-binding protein [Thermodesulfobacteriota bacterium]